MCVCVCVNGAVPLMQRNSRHNFAKHLHFKRRIGVTRKEIVYFVVGYYCSSC